MSIRTISTGGALVIFALSPSLVSAQSSSKDSIRSPGTSIHIVNYRDLDLRAPEGQKQLYRRVTNAVFQLCAANTVSTIPLYELVGQKRCKIAANREAEPQITAAILQARNRTGLANISGPSVVRLTAR